MFAHACKLGLEGIVSKRAGSRYRSGTSRNWLKSSAPNFNAGEERPRPWSKLRARACRRFWCVS